MVSISIINTALVSTMYRYLAQVSRSYCSAAPVYSLRARYCSDKVNSSGVCNGVSEEPRRGTVFIIKRQTGRIIELEAEVHTKVSYDLCIWDPISTYRGMGQCPLALCLISLHSVLIVKAVVAAFNQEMDLVGAFSVSVTKNFCTNFRLKLWRRT